MSLAIPVLIHLVRREQVHGRPFPSLMFLRRVNYKVRFKKALRDLPLLAMRLLALLLLIVGQFVAKVVFNEELRAIDRWFVETLGFSHLWLSLPLICIYVIHRLRSRKKKHPKGDRLALPPE